MFQTIWKIFYEIQRHNL